MKKVLFIVNPKSGKGNIRSKLMDIVDIFVKAEFDLTIYTTQAAGDARRKVFEEAGDYELVVCSGGDGTLDEVISGMMDREEKCPIGYIPSGSTNDFANSLKIPKNMVKAAEHIAAQKTFSCDIGSFNGDYFVYIAAFGLFTDVSYETSQDVKNVLGHMAYILEGAKKLANIKSYNAVVRANDKEIAGSFIYGMVTNSVSVGGFRNITGKHVHLDDGVFEVTLVRKPQNLIELQEIITCLLTRTPDDKYFYQFRSECVNFSFEEEVPWTLDGEYGGDHVKVDVHNVMQALEIIA